MHGPILIVIFLIVGCFAFVLVRGAPYLPTLSPQVQAALDLVDLKKGQTLLELGCGDGKVLIAAADRGLKAIGYELNPILALVAWLRTRRYKGRVRVVCGDFWRAKWPPADGIFVFLLNPYMAKLHMAITDYPHKPVKLVSFAFKLPKKTPKKVQDGVYLYLYK